MLMENIKFHKDNQKVLESQRMLYYVSFVIIYMQSIYWI